MLDGRVCLVAGGGNGLGEAAARELAEHGASVVVSDLGTSVRGEGRNPDVAEAVAASIQEDGGTATAHCGDLTEFDYAKSLVRDTVAEYGRLDFVANFAGILRDEMSYRLDEADWHAVLETNLTGQFALLQAACQHWREVAESGDDGESADGLDVERSYLAASSYAAKGNLGQVNYAASKAGVLGMVRSVSTEMARNDVRVNALVPNGYTRMTETVPEDHRPYTKEEMPPEKVAPLVAYLASEDAAGITGCTLYAGGDRVGVFSEPSLDTVGVRPGGWSLEELQTHFREDVADEVDLHRTDAFF